MNHKSCTYCWINYSLALLLAFALSWGLTQPALAAPVATNLIIGPISPVNSEPGFLRVDFDLLSDGGTVPLTGVVTVTGSWGGGCTVTVTAAHNSLIASGYAVTNESCVSSPPAGVHTVTVTYSGDSNYAPSTSSPVEITAKFQITVGITTHTPDPSSVDGSVLVQYSLTPRRAVSVSPTGTVMVSDGVNSCEATVAAGQCNLILETAGVRTLTASYSGDSLFRTGSASVGHTVIGYLSITRITADTPDPSTQGQAINVSYSVVANDPSKGTPSGNVTVSDGVDSCTGTVAAGSCSLTLNTLGTRTLTATYAGNTRFASSTSADEPHTVNAPDTTPPTITVNGTKADGTPYTVATWTNQNVLVHFTCSDTGSDIATCPSDPLFSLDGTFTAEGTATDNAGNSATVSFGPIQIDKTAPTISAAATVAPNGNGWYNSNVTIRFTCADNLSGVTSCPADEILSSEGAAVSSTAQTITDQAGNSSTASNVVTVQLDKTAPVVTVTGVSDGASYTLGSVPAAGCSANDATSGVATQATVSVTGGNGDGTGSFTATCSGATDLAGNSAAGVSVSYTVSAPVDACTTTALRDDFNRANGGLGSNWAGLTSQSFYKLASNRVDVQVGGPVVWKPTSYGVNQAAFVTLSTLDLFSPAQGVLLKVQSGTIPNAGAISVVYDSLAKAVRVSTLRLNALAWTVYAPTPATVANGDKLTGCVQANGTVRVYQNNTLLTTVTLNAADQSFFNGKGGKIGLWTVAAPNALFDDFGGGALTGVSSAALDATAVPDEVADDGAEIAVGSIPDAVVDPLTDDATTNPATGAFVARLFLPLVNR